MAISLPSPRHAKWGLLLLLVGCLYATVVPSVSKYGAALVANNDNDLNLERRRRGRSPAVISSGASHNNDSATSPLRYGDGAENRTLPRDPSGRGGVVAANSSSIDARIADDEPRAANGTTLVIVMGNLRGGEDAWNTLYANVLVPNDADLALLVMDDLTQYPNSSLLTKAKYVWWYDRYDDWADAIDLVNGTSWRETHLPQFVEVNRRRANWTRGVDPTAERPSVLFGGIKGFFGSAMIIFMLRWFVVQHVQSERILDQYDRFCVTRTDHYYVCPQNYSELDLGGKNVWIPSGEDYGGYNDRHLVVGRDNLLDALDIVPQLIGNPFHYSHRTHYNSESFLKYVWGQKNLTVRRFQRGMFIASTGKDPGNKVPFNMSPNLSVKYPGEIEEAVRCQWRNGRYVDLPR